MEKLLGAFDVASPASPAELSMSGSGAGCGSALDGSSPAGRFSLRVSGCADAAAVVVVPKVGRPGAATPSWQSWWSTIVAFVDPDLLPLDGPTPYVDRQNYGPRG